MIVVDIETSGGYPDTAGVWQIGAIDFYNPEDYFLEEARIDDKDVVEEAAVRVHGKDEEELRDKNKQSQKQLIENFLKWVKKKKIKNMISQCPHIIDFPLLRLKARKYGIEFPFHYRAFDLHSIAQMKHFQIKGEFLIKEDHSDLGLTNILKFCGMEDKRKQFSGKSFNSELVKDGTPHNALEDAKLTAECFSRLIYGKNLLPEYSKFKIPEYLLKEKIK